MDCVMPDIDVVRGVLRTACSRQGALDRLEATYIQAGASGPVRVLYEVKAGNGDVLRVAARRVTPSKGPQIESAINARSPRPAPGFVQAALYAPDLDLLFQVFPIDARLPSLPVAVDAAAMTAILPRSLGIPESRGRLQSVDVHVMRYKPERKCLLRYDLTWAADVERRLPHVVWARVARQTKFERTAETLPRLYASADGLGFDLPEPLGTVPELAMQLFGSVPGSALFTLVQREDFPVLCRRTGEALCRFHHLPVRVDEVFDLDEQLKRLAENAVEFAWMLPDQTARITGLEREIAMRLRAATPLPPRLIHRDFHGDNILAADGRLALLDFEDCAMGDPADDVGSNWAQLTWHVHKAGGRTEWPAAGRHAFLDGYLDAAPRLARPKRSGQADRLIASHLPTYAAMHCFLYAHQCLRHPQDPARHEDAEAMLTACEEVLDRGLR